MDEFDKKKSQKLKIWISHQRNLCRNEDRLSCRNWKIPRISEGITIFKIQYEHNINYYRNGIHNKQPIIAIFPMNRIKFLQDKRNNFRRISLNDDLCTIMKEPIGVIINPTHILQIHRIPRDHGKNWPVIANFKNVKIKYRAKQ